MICVASNSDGTETCILLLFITLNMSCGRGDEEWQWRCSV